MNWIKKHLSLLLAAALALSLVGNYIQYFWYRESLAEASQPPAPVGTYCTDRYGTTGLYVVLDQQGNYCRYRQFKVLETGRYTCVDAQAGLYSLWEEDGAQLGLALLIGDSLYLVQMDGTVQAYPKADDVPGYINVRNPFF